MCVPGGTRGVALWSVSSTYGGGDWRVAPPEAPTARTSQAHRHRLRTLPPRPPPVDRQFRARLRIRVRFLTLVRAPTVHHVRGVRAAAEDRASVGVPSIGWCDDVRVDSSVLRRTSVRVRSVRVLYLFAVRAGHVCLAGRPRASDGRGMTARGPGAPAPAPAAASPPRAPARLPPATSDALAARRPRTQPAHGTVPR